MDNNKIQLDPTVLIRVIVNNDVKGLKKLTRLRDTDQLEGLDLNAVIETTEHAGWTPLLLAIRFDKQKMIHALIENGADVYLQAENELSAVRYAAFGVEIDEAKREALLLTLLEKHRGYLPESPEIFTNILIAWFINGSCKNAEVANQLLRRGGNPNAFNTEGINLLYKAACDQNLPLVSMLLHYGADTSIEISEEMITVYDLVLMFSEKVAATQREYAWELLDELLAADMSKDRTDNEALQQTFSRILRNLCHLGLYKQAKKLVLFMTADAINGSANYGPYPGWTPLHFAVVSDASAPLVRLLLSRGASPRALNADGNSPTMLTRSKKILSIFYPTNQERLAGLAGPSSESSSPVSVKGSRNRDDGVEGADRFHL